MTAFTPYRRSLRRGTPAVRVVVLSLLVFASAALASSGRADGVPLASGSPALAGTALSGTALSGTVRSGDLPLGGAEVTLWTLRASASTSAAQILATARADADGHFRLVIAGTSMTTASSDDVYYVTARTGGAVELAAVLGEPDQATVVLDERTTTAAGFGLAQFIHADTVAGAAPGPHNAAMMTADLVDSRTGALSPVLTSPPNGDRTWTLREFDSLANLVGGCVRQPSRCVDLLRLAAAPGAVAPATTLDAVATIARNPAHNFAALSAQAAQAPQLYRPALAPSDGQGSDPLDSWTLALRFDGDGSSLNGPGNFAIDARGDVWTTANYTYSPNPLADVCGGKTLFEFAPDGRYVSGSPYSGGGVDGAGFGITVDPHGSVWVGNFGFASKNCAAPPPRDSVSDFTADGQPVSPATGFTNGGIDQPQGTVSDLGGAIWIADCGSDRVTRYPNGVPSAATTSPGPSHPFGVASDNRGRVFVTGNGDNTVRVLNPDGTAGSAPITGGGLDRPLGIAADLEGNMWVADSGVVGVPCGPGNPGQFARPTQAPSISLVPGDGYTAPTRFAGGGLTIPWGIAVDGSDHVWVANFGGRRLSEFCGTTTTSCPPGTRSGQPLSPAQGFSFDGLTRNTGVAIDPAGNVWVANNWKNLPVPPLNPGAYQVVVFVGAATPLRTPLIGQPTPLG